MAKPEARVHRRVFRVDAGLDAGDATQVVIGEALALGLRPTGPPYIESDVQDGGQRVTTWAVGVEDNIR